MCVLNYVLSWLLEPKLLRDEYISKYSKNQDCKAGKEILSNPESWLLSLHHFQVGGADLPLASVYEVEMKNFMIRIWKMFSRLSYLCGKFLFAWGFLVGFFLCGQHWKCYMPECKITQVKGRIMKTTLSPSWWDKSKEEHVNTVPRVLTCISPQSSASNKSEFHLSGC